MEDRAAAIHLGNAAEQVWLLEHPALCDAETGRLVTHAVQAKCPSSKYLGHNLYAHIFERFAQLQEELQAQLQLLL